MKARWLVVALLIAFLPFAQADEPKKPIRMTFEGGSLVRSTNRCGGPTPLRPSTHVAPEFFLRLDPAQCLPISANKFSVSVRAFELRSILVQETLRTTSRMYWPA